MSVADLVDQQTATALGDELHAFAAELFPICRSITGDGVRSTLDRVGKEVPLVRHEVASGSRAFDWTVPDEWNVREAFVTDRRGRRVVDLAEHTLHLVSYSTPVDARMDLEELRPHLHTLPDHPEWIPYRTSYYARDWGFCLSERQLAQLGPGPYDVRIDSTLEPGHLSYGECVLPGSSTDEVLVSTHVCHPSMANDNLSGLAVATALARLLADVPHRLTYRFVFVPGTIGSLTWLSRNEETVSRVRHGLVLTGLGGPGPLVWKRSRHGHRDVDAAAEHVVATRHGEIRDFAPWGYDERQYNSPGFDLPVGRLTRTPHGEYPEYHTSADDLSLITGERLAEALTALLEIIDVLEHDRFPRSLNPKGEPQLGQRGLYPKVGGRSADASVMAMLWLLNLADGEHSLLDVARRSGTAFHTIRAVDARLRDHGLVDRPEEPRTLDGVTLAT